MSQQSWKDIAYDTMPGGMVKFITDETLTVLDCDDKFCRMTGFSSGEIIKNGLIYFCDPLDQEFVRRSIRTQAREKRRLQLEFRFKNQNGALMWYQMAGSYIETENNCAVYICSLYDVTEAHILQGRLRENLRALQSKQDEINELYHTVISGFAQIAADQWYTILFANDRLFELVGYTRFQVKTLFNNEAGRLVHPRDLESFRTIIHSMNGKGRFSTKFRLLHRDGSFAWIRLDGSFTNKFHDGVPVFYCFYTDIDEQKEQESALRRQQYFTSLVTSSITGGLTIFYDRYDWPIAYISQSLLDLLGYTEKEFLERTKGNLRRIVYPEDLSKVEQAFELQCAEGPEYELEFRVEKSDGSIIWILEKGKKTKDEDNEILFVSMYMDITERKIRTDDLVHQSTHDSLTKLHNRAYTRQSIESYLAAHGDKHSSALILLDLDNFKQVNDLYGHGEGDYVLISIGKLLSDTFLTKDIIGRMGGDEFIVFLKEIRSESILNSKAQTLCDAIRNICPEKYRWLSASIGIIFIQNQVVTYDELVQAADLAMYQAKFNGKNSWYLRTDLTNHNTFNLCDGSYPLPALSSDAHTSIKPDCDERTYEHRSALWDAFPIKLELNLSKQCFSLLQSNSMDFVDFPDGGSLHTLQSVLSEIIHPFYYRQCIQYFQIDKNHPLYQRNATPIIENLMCLVSNGTYRHLCCLIVPMVDQNGDHLLLLSLADAEKGYESRPGERGGSQGFRFLDSQQYHLALTQSGVIIFDWNHDENTLYYSSNLHHFVFLDQSAEQASGNMAQGQGTHPEDWKIFQQFYEDIMNSDISSAEATIRLVCRDGSYLWCRLTASVMRDRKGIPHRILGTITNVNDAILSKQQLKYQEQHDPLTGLCNYAYYQTCVMDCLKETDSRRYCLSYCDIKSFKYINDIYGYETGDQLLRYLSDVICQCVPTDAIIGRLSADRISVLRQYTSREKIKDCFEQCAYALLAYRDPVTMQPIKVEIACGFYCIDSALDVAPFHDMINRASIAQKSVKDQPGSRCTFYSRQLRDQLIHEKEWELSLFNALENNEFAVFLQPQVSIQYATQVVGAEALVRWKQSDGTMVAPSEFIPLFEKTGGIIHLDYYVFETVCQYLKRRISEDKPVYQISVNVSRITMMDPMFTEKYCMLKNQYELPDNVLVLECTETAIIEDLVQFQLILKTLRKHGFLVAMDDFGTGYSSLNLLKNIDIDILKLDMGFFRGQDDPMKSDAIISGVFNIAKALNLQTLAEGIESMPLVDMLRQYGCDSIQGYVFSKPRPIEEFDEVISEITAQTSKIRLCKEETTDTKTTD